MNQDGRKIIRKLLAAQLALKEADQGIVEAREGISEAESKLAFAESRRDFIGQEVTSWTERFQMELPLILAAAVRYAKGAGEILAKAQKASVEEILGMLENAEANLRASLNVVTSITQQKEQNETGLEGDTAETSKSPTKQRSA